MKERTITQRRRETIESYCLINHEYETTAEMAAALKETFQRIHYTCKELGITPITPEQQTIEYILTHHKTETTKEMAVGAKKSPQHIRDVCKQLGIKPIRKKKPELMNDKELDDFIAKHQKKKPERVNDPYTQSSAGAADELRGIKVTGQYENRFGHLLKI